MTAAGARTQSRENVGALTHPPVLRDCAAELGTRGNTRESPPNRVPTISACQQLYRDPVMSTRTRLARDHWLTFLPGPGVRWTWSSPQVKDWRAGHALR